MARPFHGTMVLGQCETTVTTDVIELLCYCGTMAA